LNTGHLEIGVIIIQCYNYLTESSSFFKLSTNSDCFKSLIMTKERREPSIIELKYKLLILTLRYNI